MSGVREAAAENPKCKPRRNPINGNAVEAQDRLGLLQETPSEKRRANNNNWYTKKNFIHGINPMKIGMKPVQSLASWYVVN